MTKPELTPEIVEAIKTQHQGVSIYKTTLFDIDFVFSFITRDDYKFIQEWISESTNLTDDDYDSKIIDYALLWPPVAPMDWLTMPAGVTRALSKSIQEKSYLKTDINGNFEDVDIEDLVKVSTSKVPTDKEKEKLKSNSKFPLKAVTIDGSVYVVRPMMRSEYNLLQKLSKDVDGEVEGVKKCLVFPESDKVDWEKINAGVPSILGNIIYLASGFNAPSSVVEL